jgi:hypothetical protein
MDWNNWFAYDLTYWFSPMQLLVIPTTFFYVINARPSRTMAFLVNCSLIELLILVPLWYLIIWPFLGLAVLGLYWI